MEKHCFQVNGLCVEAEFSASDRENILLPLLRRLGALQREKGRRICVFFAAPPAAGKSTLCCYLEQLSRAAPDLTPVQCVGIDGFHYYRDYLQSHFIMRDGERLPLAAIKGAPESYDVEKLAILLDSLDEDGRKWPVYDRRIHDPVEDAVEIREKIIILEGNWLLLDEAPWNRLSCDHSIFLAAGERSQLERIVRRKRMGGYSEAQAREMAERNDWPNILRCMAGSRRGDLNLGRDADGSLRII